VKFWWKKYKIQGKIFISTSNMKNLEIKNFLVEVIEILVPEQYIPSRAFILSFNIFLFPSDSGYLNKNK
jgi:hypothetical protein